MDIDESSQNTDLHVTVIETATGKTLSGDEAPLASDVDVWLDSHPGWELVSERESIYWFARYKPLRKLYNFFSWKRTPRKMTMIMKTKMRKIQQNKAAPLSKMMTLMQNQLLIKPKWRMMSTKQTNRLIIGK